MAGADESMRRFVLYLVVFLAGGVLMGFEMLGSRFLYPYFGGGIATWAGLISTVLYALAIGYFAGGALVDRRPTAAAVLVSLIGAAAYLLLIPALADRVLQAILDGFG